MKTVGSSDIKVVLNGGSNVLDSATIPVRWGFSSNLVEKNPQYVAIVDIKGKSLSDLESVNDFNFYEEDVVFIGKTKELAAYIPLKSSGKHTFLVYVFCGDTKKDASEYVNRYVRRKHRNIFYGDLERGVEGAVYITATDFEVPDELFAHKPKEGFKKFIWNWVNKYFKKEPIDQCQYRKRKMFAFTMQPLVFVFHMVGMGFAKFVGGVFVIAAYLYWFLGSLFLLFFGFRPIGIKDFGGENSNEIHNLFYFRRIRGFSRWRLWKSREKYWWDDHNDNKKIPLYFTPFLYVVVGLITWMIYSIISSVGEEVISTTENNYSVLVGIVVLLLAIYSIKKLRLRNRHKREEKRKKKDEERKKKRKEIERELEEYRIVKQKEEGDKEKEFLKANASLKNLPPKVVIKDVIKRVEVSTKFKLGFMAAKSKICKPFA